MENHEKHNELELLHKEAKRIEEDCIYSAKSHFNAEAVWKTWHYIIGIPAILTAVIISSMILKMYLAEGVIIIIGIIGTILTSLLTFLKPYEKVNEHHNPKSRFGISIILF